MPRPGLLVFSLIALGHSAWSATEDKDRLIRTTEPLSPEQEQQGFHLPEGFSIQLFADESQLKGKPINMAFDAKGRLWVSCTREYPFAVPKERWSDPQGTRARGSRDAIRVLEDTDGDGRADKATVFADELNIPTGVLPYKNGCIAWSIPNIWYFEDTDGDGKCDKRSILFGPLGWEKDTHGMISSLRLGLDGWVYATHGFSNTSHFEVRPENRRKNDEARMTNAGKGKAQGPSDARSQISSFDIRHSDLSPDSGQSLDITSGSVFRFKPDGSRVELWTSGQVNPFGLCWDSWGNLYSADCHSNPITQLIRGAEYPQFGKPAGPLGFAPVMCEHAHGSTGLCGIIYLDGGVWGPDWDDHMFVGNCVTSRVNHDHITFIGATPKANEAPDFLTSDDPWFRPVDLQLGPDSALYVADFYNRIIGHYEVPLDHAGRDRDRGRIWRVVKEGFTKKLTECDLSAVTVAKGIEELASGNLTRRHLTAAVLADRGPAIWPELESATLKEQTTHTANAHIAWLALRFGTVSVTLLDRLRNIQGEPNAPAFERDIPNYSFVSKTGQKVSFPQRSTSFISQHVMRMIGEGQGEIGVPNAYQFFIGAYAAPPTGGSGPLIISRVSGAEGGPLYTAAKIEALGCSGDPAATLTVLEYVARGSADAVAQLKARIALRKLLSLERSFDSLLVEDMPSDVAEVVARVAVAVPAPHVAAWLLRWLDHFGGHRDTDASLRLQALTHVAHHLPTARNSELVSLMKQHFAGDLDTQLDLFAAIQEGRSKSLDEAEKPDESLDAWSTELTSGLLRLLQSQPATYWKPGTPPTESTPNPWQTAVRKCADGRARDFLDSHVAPGSEKHTGTLRSAPFVLPQKLTFWLAGHNGFPTAKSHNKNSVRLILAESGEELALAYPPRNDVAQEVVWDLKDKAKPGTEVVLELTDGDTANAYAWLAVGGFEPAVVSVPADLLKRDSRIGMLAKLDIDARTPSAASRYLAELPDKSGFKPDTRAALAEALARRSGNPVMMQFVPLARDGELASTVFAALSSGPAVRYEVERAFKTLPFRTQAKLAAALAGATEGANMVLDLAAPSVLADPLVSAKLKALNHPEIRQRLDTITASLPPQSEALNKQIAARLKSYDPAKADATKGEQVFIAVCSVCHRIGVRGNLVGPQLDGIGARGAERLLEDILDPNRAVDPAFRLHMVKRKDGTLFSGLMRREEGEGLVFADAAAQETKIAKQDIASDEESAFSLMPPGLGEALSEQQLHDLLAYLLGRK